MSEQDRDPALERAFRVLRDTERLRVPAFRVQATGNRQRATEGRATGNRQPTGGRLAVLGALAAGSAVAIALLFILPARARSAELELAREVLAWRSPTGFLLEFPGRDLLTTLPVLDRAVAGSPLSVLDPGGELGPPVTSRSPQ